MYTLLCHRHYYKVIKTFLNQRKHLFQGLNRMMFLMYLLLTYFYALLFCKLIFYFKLKVKRQGHPKRWNTTLLYIVRRNKPENRKLYLKKDIIYRPWNMKGNTRRCQKWLKHSTLTALKCAGWIPATICEWSSLF